MIFRTQILAFVLCLTFTSVFAQQFDALEFIENKGQWDPRVRFMGTVPGGALFIHPSGFTVLQHNPEDWQTVQDKLHGHIDKTRASQPERTTVRSHAYAVEFVGANPNPQIIADKPLPNYNNYFIGSDPSKWAAGCKIYQGITIQNLYPNVDIRYYSHNGRMKYDLMVKPGADVSKIALRYNGVDKLEIRNRELVIKTSIGDIKELDPYTYQYQNEGRKQVVARYSLKDNIVRFDVKNYDKSSLLIIDPTIIFASFSGSTTDNWGYTATYDDEGNFYGGGIVFGQGFPTSVGAFQQDFQGGISGCNGKAFDIGIIKLSPDGSTRMYATYIGGSGNEQPHSLVVDGEGNLVLAGRTNSLNYPTTGSGLIGPGGAYDIVVTKLNAAGNALIGSKKIGGKGDDGMNIRDCHQGPISLQYNYGDDGRSEVILDGGGNIYVASCTQSNDFPTVGGFQTTFGGKQDGVILKLPPNVSTLTFSSYLGGSENDASYVLSLNPLNSTIYVGGGTESGNLPGTDGNSLNNRNQGGIDGYVASISNNGASLLRTTYLGTNGTDQVFGVQFDRMGFPYVMGQTTGSWPIQNAPWSQAGGKQFIAKLQPDLSRFVYSTVFGTGSAVPNISPVAFLVDRCENVYVSGWGGKISDLSYPTAGTSGLTTVNPLQPTTDGKDFYFFVLKKDAASQLYGDFFGQSGGLVDHVDGGTSRFDANGVIYQAICANCGGQANFPTTLGVWSPTNRSANCNLAMVKIAMNLSGVQSTIQSSINGAPRDTAGCVPLTVDFTDTLATGVTYEWNFGDGSPQEVTSVPTNRHTYNAVGTYRVMLVAVDSTTCNMRDTAYMNIRVGDLRANLDFNPVKLNPCDSFKYRFDNLSTQPGVRPFTSSSFVWDFGDGSPRQTAGTASVFHNYKAAGTYRVKLILIDTGYCNAPDSVEKVLRIATLVKARFTTPPTGCAPYQARFTNTSDGGQQFIWNFGDGTTSTEVNPSHTFAAGTYTITLTAIDSATCNITDSTRVTITVYNNPTAEFNAAPQPPTVNTPITFTNLSSSDAVRFKWLFGDGDSLLTNSRLEVQHEYNETKIYNACLLAYNANGCVDTVCKPVSILVEPALDVPNAFTPLSGDVNSQVFVRGYAIGKMKFIIWNRWGQKVFESDNKRAGWDGKFNGVLQPMDVYTYTLEAQFTDGTKATKKGDITLIR